jgi:hypothetical protein
VSPNGSSKVIVLGDVPRTAVKDDSESRTFVLYGSPTVNDRIVSDIGQLGDLSRGPGIFARDLNGEFAVIIETPDQVFIANDRFASHPIFYLSDALNLVISFSYLAIWRWLNKNNRLNIDSLAFYEFLHFQRLFGETTFDKATRVLPPATVLSFSKTTGDIKLDRYWKPDFSKRHDGRAAIARDLADAVSASAARKTADVSSVALLLSGGMDSRVVLGGFNGSNLPLCITVGEAENNEVDVARSLANVAAARHTFVQRSASHYRDILPASTATGGGMYSFQHGHFFGLDFPETDLILHGHGFDYFFQGMYLPSHRRRVLGRSTRSWALDPIGFDLVGQYISDAKYRLKGVDSTSLLRRGVVTEAADRLKDDLDVVLNSMTGEAVEPYDEWDYLTTSAPSRHYTYLNLLSAGSIAEQRTVAFDNDIFDIYYSTPADIRHGTMLLAETTGFLNPSLLKVRNANTNLRPDLSPPKLTLSGWMRSAKRRIGIGGSDNADPSVSDRSWPAGDSLLRGSDSLLAQIAGLQTSGHLERLGIFDLSQVGKLTETFQSGDNSAATALLTLITIDTFLGSSA